MGTSRIRIIVWGIVILLVVNWALDTKGDLLTLKRDMLKYELEVLEFDNTSLEKQIELIERVDKLQSYLESKGSPLAQEAKHLLESDHWELAIAVSAIESQYCTRQRGNNCWGIGGSYAYRNYDNLKLAINDFENLIKKWHDRGRWLTPEDMNCSYVQPCNPNWVAVVNKTLEEINALNI